MKPHQHAKGRSKAPSPPDLPGQLPEGNSSSVMHNGKRICILEDGHTVALRYANRMRTRGWIVDVFEHADDFLIRITNGTLQKPDMAVFDITIEHSHALPIEETDGGEVEGIQLAQIFRSLQQYETVPIILISGSGIPEVLKDAEMAAKKMTADTKCDCIFVKRDDSPPTKLPLIIEDYFKNGSFHSSAYHKRLIFQVPFFPFFKLEFERKH